jgi:hypothetical protein
VGKPEGKRPPGRAYVDGRIFIMKDLLEVTCMDWIELAQDRDMWRKLVNAAMNMDNNVKSTLKIN